MYCMCSRVCERPACTPGSSAIALPATSIRSTPLKVPWSMMSSWPTATWTTCEAIGWRIS